MGESARISLDQTHAIAVSNWSGCDLDEELDLWAREKRDRVLDRPGIVEAFEQLDREPEELSLQAEVIGTAPQASMPMRHGLVLAAAAKSLPFEHWR